MDHIGNALLVLFDLATQEGWPDIMYTYFDANGDDEVKIFK